MFDNGSWYYATEPKNEFSARYFVESHDSDADVRLYINGNFADDDERRAYGEKLATFLNEGKPGCLYKERP